MQKTGDERISEKILEKCRTGQDVRSQFPSQFAILEINATELLFAGRSLLALEDFRIADESQLRGQLIAPLYDMASELVDNHKWAGEYATCWPPFEGRVLIAAHPDAGSDLIRMSMYTLGQAQFSTFSFWVDSPETTTKAQSNPPKPAWVPPPFITEPEAEPEVERDAEPDPPAPPTPKKALSPEEKAIKDLSLCCIRPLVEPRFPTPDFHASLTRTTLESGFSLLYRPAPGPDNPDSKEKEKRQIFTKGTPADQEKAVREWFAGLAIHPSVEIDWMDVPATVSSTRDLLEGGSFVLQNFPTARWVITGGLESGQAAQGRSLSSPIHPGENPGSREPEKLAPNDWIAVLQRTTSICSVPLQRIPSPKPCWQPVFLRQPLLQCSSTAWANGPGSSSLQTKSNLCATNLALTALFGRENPASLSKAVLLQFPAYGKTSPSQS